MIWIVRWSNESGDIGVIGYWEVKPTEKELDAFMAEYNPCDFEAGTLCYVLESMNKR